MLLTRSLSSLLPLCLLISGCDKLLPKVTAEDEKAARHAMPMSEVSLMVRSHYDQNKLIAEIERRRVPAVIDGPTEANLTRFGAKPPLIAVLKNPANALTRIQKQAFDELTIKREGQTSNERDFAGQATQERAASASPQSVAKTETPEEAYWKAEADYRKKRTQLEGQIATEQGRLNQYYRWGSVYYQSQITATEARLHQYQDDLKNLQTPIR